MNVKKIKLEDVKDGSLSFDVVRKEFVKSIMAMEGTHNSMDTAVDFYACIDQSYDNGKSQDLLFTLGALKTTWKPHINGQCKDGSQKKKVLWGQCYLEVIDGQKTLQLIPQKGSAKLNKISKAGKMLFKKAGVILGIAAGVAYEEDQEEDNEENVETTNTTDSKGNPDSTNKEAETKRNIRKGKLNQMIQNVGTLQNALGKADRSKIQSNLDKYKGVLDGIIEEAKKDGVIQPEEQTSIDQLNQAIQNVEEQLAKGNNGPKRKITPEQRAKIKDNMNILKDRLAAITKSLGL